MRKLNYQLDKGKKEPLYLQLYQQLRDLIYTQQLAFGEQLPSKEPYVIICRSVKIPWKLPMRSYSQKVILNPLHDVVFLCAFNLLCFFQHQSKHNSHTVAPRHSTIAFDFNPHYIDSKHFPLKTGVRRVKRYSKHAIQAY